MYILLECFVVWFDLWLKSRQTIKEIWNCVGPLEWTSVLAEVATCFVFYANDCQLQANLNTGHYTLCKFDQFFGLWSFGSRDMWQFLRSHIHRWKLEKGFCDCILRFTWLLCSYWCILIKEKFKDKNFMGSKLSHWKNYVPQKLPGILYAVIIDIRLY